MSDRVVALKVGKIKTYTTDNKKSWVSAIKKEAIGEAFLGKEGFVIDEQADRKHHGGVHKAVLFASLKSYAKLGELLGTVFETDIFAPLGENIVVEYFDEENICVGDVLKVGETVIEVSQPREPCHKLSKSTGIKAMTKTVYETGLSGWYGRILEEGVVKKGDRIERIEQGDSGLSIILLNHMIQSPEVYPKDVERALASEKLGPSFKESLRKKTKA